LQRLARDLQQAEQGLVQRVLDDLQTGRAADFDYERYRRADKDEQRKMYLRNGKVWTVSDDPNDAMYGQPRPRTIPPAGDGR